MANIDLRGIRLVITWDKSNPAQLTYDVHAQGRVPDDTEPIPGEKAQGASDLGNLITRTQFRALTGAQLESQIKAQAIAALQALGSGSGTHTITDDTGQ